MFKIAENKELGQAYFYFESKNGRLFLASQVMKQLGYAGGNKTLYSYNLIDNIDVVKFLKKDSPYIFLELNDRDLIGLRAGEALFISESGLEKFLLQSNKMNIEKIYKWLFPNKPFTIVKKLKESSSLEVIFNAYPNLFIHQYSVLNYRLDAYSAKHNLILECDENGHSGKKIQDFEREKKINKELKNPIWIRYNPDAPDFNIGKIIFQINKQIFK